MKAWLITLILFILINISFIIGFSVGFDSGFIEGSKPQFENCGFYYDYTTNTYTRNIIEINWSVYNGSFNE